MTASTNGGLGAAMAAASRPNILFIVVDDCGYADLSCCGQTDYSTNTPNNVLVGAHTNLLAEYSRAASLGLSDKQLLQLAEQSFHVAFLPPLDKRKYLEDFSNAAKMRGLL